MARYNGFAFRRMACIALALLALVPAGRAMAQAGAGFSEYVIPGNEGQSAELNASSTQLGLYYVFNQLDTGTTPASSNMHSVITVTAWAPNTTVYYDHWEDGFDFDSNNPSTADETVVLAAPGAVKTFESANFAIPVLAKTLGTGCNTVGGCVYNGGDRIYVAGGAVTVTRAGWIQERNESTQAVAWEIYPVKPQLTTYVLPFGENLYPANAAFQRVFALVQATADGTTFQVDVDGNGSWDVLNVNRDGTLGNGTDSATITLNAGQTFLLDAISACSNGTNCTTTPGTAPNQLRTGAVIQGSSTLQVKFVAGVTTADYGTRGLSAFPRGYWTKEYYAPLDQRSTANGSGTDYFLHNPHSSPLIVSWESRTSNGWFSIAARSTVSFKAATSSNVPVDSGLYFSAPDVFWGVGLGDTTGVAYEWGFSLLPATFLSSEHYIGWAPGSTTRAVGTYNFNGVFLVAAQDHTRVFVDFNSDGVPDQTYDLNRLETQFIYDTTDGDLTGTHFWATGEFTLAYGQNADTAPTATPALDLGYVAIPGTDFISLVLGVEKTANPQVVPTAAGSTTEFTIVASTQEYSLTGVSVHDLLPPSWAYVPGTVVIRLPDQTEITGSGANPVVLPFYADLFGAAAYTNNDSTPTGTSWTTQWREDGEADGPAAGRVRVLTDAGVTPNVIAARFEADARALARMADMSQFEGGVLRFRFRRQATDNPNDRLDVQVCANAVNATPVTCTTGWVTAPSIPGFNGTDAAYQDYSVDLATLLSTNLASATFAVRFTTASGSTLGSNDFIWIDHVRIEPPGTFKWPASTLGSMAPNQTLQITFDAQTTAALPAGTLSRNQVLATGSRTVGSPAVTQTFSATDFAYVGTGSLQIEKTSSAPSPLYPGDTFGYTVTVTNPAGSPTQTRVSLYDTLPAGLTFSPGTTLLNRSSVGDSFDAVAYTNSNGTRPWATTWAETGDTGAAGGGNLSVTAGELRLNNANGGTTNSIQRSVTLPASGVTSAAVTFQYRTSGTLEPTDQIVFGYSVNDAAFVETSFDDDVSGTFTATIANPSNTLVVRFRFPTASEDFIGGDEYFYVDDFSITWDQSVAGGNPPNLLSGSSLYSLAAGQSLTATFSVKVDNPFPSGSNILTNVAAVTSTQLPIQITASVTDQVTVPTLLSATVAGRVWFDADGDGVQDIGEPGLSNVQVTLKDQFGTPVATLTTDINGRYLFTGVTPGNGYYVEVQSGLPAGIVQSHPTGHSDGRTNSFNLTAGLNFTGADLGYKPLPTTASFGDTVWVDADGDGLRDAGEVGLGGVTVQLYRDVNGDGLLQPGTDTLVGTTTSAADGSYFFSGVSPGSTYFVSATTPGGYAPTSDTVYRFNSVAAGTAYLTADFGFAGLPGTTYSLSDRIWSDLDQDGVFDAGENGISGVTVEILDASMNVIGVTTTAADGTFTFSGLPGNGANYTTRISDTGNVLTNFTGTNAYALARQRSEPNLTANRDRTAAPSYGFFAARSIGDTVYFDVDGDGTQDAGEAGIAGIVVGLYRDLDGDGVIDAGEPLVGTVTTDAAGHYLFSGLSDGSFIVSVPPLTGYTYTGTGATADSDSVTLGVQRPAVVTGGANVLGIDLGYQANTPASVSGTIWNDANRDGLIGGAEPRLAGVTVDILSGTTVVATVTTDATGAYSFAGLAAGSYTVRVTDVAGVLNGYSPTYEASEGTTPPFNYQEVVTLAAGSNVGPRFGYALPTPTYVSVAWLKATTAGGTVTVEWETTQEVGTIGFDLHRLDAKSGEWVKVNDELLPALFGHPEGGTYTLQDASAPVALPLTYKLVEVDAWGASREYGPWVVQEFVEGTLPFERYSRTPATISAAERGRIWTLKREKGAAVAARGGQKGSLVKVRTTGAGLRFLDLGTLAGLLGEKPNSLASRIGSGRVTVKNRGRTIPYLPVAGGAGIYFYADGMESPYSDENVYWISTQKGVTMFSTVSPPGGRTPEATFPQTVHSEVDRYPLPAYFQAPQADFYCWDNIYAGSATLGTKSFVTALSGVSGIGEASLTVRLQGGSDTTAPADHHVRVSWNGRVVDDAIWDGLVPHQITIPLGAGDVVEGNNTLTLTALRDVGVAYGVVYLDSFDVSYQRLYRAVGDRLDFTVPAGAEAGLAGFSTSAVTVLDVTAPANPLLVTGASAYTPGDGTYGVRFANHGATTRSYLAVTPAQATTPDDVSPVEASNLAAVTNGADYILIAPAPLVAAAESLAAYRRTRGLDTMVVTLEDVYDEFAFGIATPIAVVDFLAHATATWSRPPQYVTLVGRGTFDYKNVQGVGDNIMPTLLAATPYGLVASDTSFAELTTGAGRGLKAIGRLPVLTSQELLDYLAKIQAHEGALAASWQKKLLLTADNTDSGGNFAADSDAVGAIAPADFTTTKVYLPTFTPSGARTAIVDAINGGALIFNYVGHGGPTQLASENIFGSTDVVALTNSGRLPVFLAMTCSAGNFAVPGYPSLGEALVVSKAGGAYAAWAPSGLSLNDGARLLNHEFFLSAFGDGEKVIGRNCTNALEALDPRGETGYMRSIYNILGEPVSRLP